MASTTATGTQSMSLSSFKVFTFTGQAFVIEAVARQKIKLTGTVAAYGRQMYDAILLVVNCKVHLRMLLKEIKREGCFYVPFYPVNLVSSWKNQIALSVERLSSDCPLATAGLAVRLLQVNQIRLPRHFDHLHQLVVGVELNECPGAQCEAQSTNTVKWFATADQLTVNQSDLWGPEPFFYFNRASQAVKCKEMSLQSELSGSMSSKRWELAESLKYTEFELLSLYSDYLMHCYPSQTMNQLVFEEFLLKTKISLVAQSSVHNPSRLFNAFCIKNGTHLSFKDLLFGLVALESSCNHGGFGGELRTRCIFRYYAATGAATIGFDEMVQLYNDVALIKKTTFDTAALASELYPSQYATDASLRQGITLDMFLRMVGKLKIRGTACLFRATQSPLAQLRQRDSFEMIWPREIAFSRLLDGKPLPQLRNTLCRQCTTAEYSMAMHSITYQPDTAVLKYFRELPEEVKFPKVVRERSLETINPEKDCNQLRLILRQYSAERFGFPKVAMESDDEKSSSKSSSSNSRAWSRLADRVSLLMSIEKICTECIELLRRGPRVVRTNSPLYIFGDIHGNFHDLMLYDHLFWRLAPNGCLGSWLFLGDYVDRGNDGIECVLYLLCLKLLMPERVHLLRGNHETRDTQRAFTFFNECAAKFTASKGTKLWELLNNVFDVLPLCALVDEEIYCAHGGIPASTHRLEDLYSIPVPLPNPSSMSTLAWEIMWNDPVRDEDFQDFMASTELPTLFPKYPHGFCPNIKRSTAYYWNSEALDLFLGHNALTFVIRAHEVMPSGFQFAMKGKMLTIFSSSNYCMANNQACVLFVEDGKLRPVKVETNRY